MDAALLARIQFGLTAGFHFLFPPTTLGLTFVILILESLYIRSKNTVYREISGFLVKILGVVFVMGVATGIVLEFAFGNNWSAYSRMVGDIFGAPLAAEGIFSFFLESVFLGILLFGRNRVSQKAYWWSSFLVFFGAHLSGLWIIIANSWMQTPAGHRIVAGKAVLTNFFQAALNHSTVIRFVHTILGGWITGTLLLCGISSWYILKKRHGEKARLLFKTAMILFAVTAFLQLGSGHLHSVQVTETQPEKMAAFEALYETQGRAPFTVFGIPDAKNQRVLLPVRIPGFLSFLVHFDPDAEVTGLNDFPEDERPPVFLPFVSYHFMILFGLLFLLIAFIAGLLGFRKKIWEARWFHRILVFSIPLPYLANEFGWMAAEVGRQPWAVFRILRTTDALSPVVSAGHILFSLALFTIVYGLIAVTGLSVVVRMIRQGPDPAPTEGQQGVA